jgi:prevent-host-death family protein
MDRVGVRELRLNAGKVLRRVKEGHAVEVTQWGRPVARLVPLIYPSVLERMVAEGAAWPASTTPAEALAIETQAGEPGEPSSEEVLADEVDDAADDLIRDGMAGRLQPGTEAFERFIDLTARRPSGEQMQAHYRDPEDHRESFTTALEALELTSEDRYLEVGFGGGQPLESALRTVRAAAGIDHSPDMLALASERNTGAIVAGRLQLVYGDVHRLPWADGEFTCAASLNMFFFVQSPETCLGDLHRVLGPGGRLVIVTAARRDDPTAGGPWTPALRTYSSDTRERMLRGAGFSTVRVSEPAAWSQVAWAARE